VLAPVTRITPCFKAASFQLASKIGAPYPYTSYMQAVKVMLVSIKSRVFEKQEYLTVKLLNFGGRILSFIRSS